LRLSAGIAALGDKEALAGALTRADHAMYAAKRGGRDRWEWSADHS
jgi:GGDEF domain-containing protein